MNCLLRSDHSFVQKTLYLLFFALFCCIRELKARFWKESVRENILDTGLSESDRSIAALSKNF